MIYLHAFCLDEGKAQDGHEEIVAGPFDWFTVTWDFLRAGRYNGGDMDHQFIRDESGFWYPVLHLSTRPDNVASTMLPDYGRGRFSDIAVLTDTDKNIASTHKEIVRDAARELPWQDTTCREEAELAEEAERAWLAQPYEG